MKKIDLDNFYRDFSKSLQLATGDTVVGKRNGAQSYTDIMNLTKKLVSLGSSDYFVYVDSDNGDDTNSGDNWGDAKQTLQAGLTLGASKIGATGKNVNVVARGQFTGEDLVFAEGVDLFALDSRISANSITSADAGSSEIFCFTLILGQPNAVTSIYGGNISIHSNYILCSNDVPFSATIPGTVNIYTNMLQLSGTLLTQLTEGTCGIYADLIVDQVGIDHAYFSADSFVRAIIGHIGNLAIANITLVNGTGGRAIVKYENWFNFTGLPMTFIESSATSATVHINNRAFQPLTNIANLITLDTFMSNVYFYDFNDAGADITIKCETPGNGTSLRIDYIQTAGGHDFIYTMDGSPVSYVGGAKPVLAGAGTIGSVFLTFIDETRGWLISGVSV